MFAPAISKVREFLSPWMNLLALGTLPLLGAWIYSRVWMVNPAILGDEYLYSMIAGKVGPWTEDTELRVVTGDLQVIGGVSLEVSGDGFSIYRIE